MLSVGVATLFLAAVALAWRSLGRDGESATPALSSPQAVTVTSSGGPELFELALARVLFAEQLDKEPLLFDPHALLVRKPGYRRVRTWEEHPRGEFRLWTNDLGFNEAEPTMRTPPDVRIVVAGDSHTQGFVDLDESYANVLEARLRAADESRSVDVLNAGVAYTGPRCYLGMLRRTLALELRPEVFIAGLFIGNDLHDEMRLDLALRGETGPTAPEGYWEPLRAVSDAAQGPVAQGFNQLYRYKHFPEEAERALELVIESYERMQELCAAEGILLVALVLPTKMDVDLDDDRERISSCQRQLELTDEEMRANQLAARRFVAAMQERGILCVDPTDAMLRADKPSYWRSDYHLNVDGHRLVAELLNEALAGRL